MLLHPYYSIIGNSETNRNKLPRSTLRPGEFFHRRQPVGSATSPMQNKFTLQGPERSEILRYSPVCVGARNVHHALLLNWFRAEGQFSSGAAEGFNTRYN
jgi:hypothetical protein